MAEARDPGTVQQLAVEPALALDRAAKAAARAVFEQREVEVTSFHDEGTGRVVYRVADLKSGEVLLQTPPDAPCGSSRARARRWPSLLWR